MRLRSAKQGLEGYLPILERTVEGIRHTGRFGNPEQWTFDWQRTYTREQWLDQLPTSGILTRLPEPGLRQVLEAVGRAIDAEGGSIAVCYSSVVIAAHAT